MAVSRLEPLIAASPSRAWRPGMGMPARSMATRPGSRSPLIKGFAFAHEEQGDLGHGGEVAARADRAFLADDGRHALVEHLDKGQRDFGPAAGASFGVDVDPAGHGPADVLDGSGVADAGGVVVDEIALEILDLLVRQDDFGEFADAGVDAVHDLAGLDLVFDHRPALLDLIQGFGRDFDAVSAAGDADERIGRQRFSVKNDGHDEPPERYGWRS